MSENTAWWKIRFGNGRRCDIRDFTVVEGEGNTTHIFHIQSGKWKDFEVPFDDVVLDLRNHHSFDYEIIRFLLEP